MEKLRVPGAGGRGPGRVVVRCPAPGTLHPAPAVDVAVVGGGPAGLAAALQLARQGVRALLFEKGRPGGQLLTANKVENYLGLPGLGGKEMARRFVRHSRKMGARILRAEVVKVDREDGFTVRTSASEWKVRAVIVATGAVPRRLEGLDPRLEDRVRYDTGDLEAFRGKKTVVLGGGDAAFDHALALKGVCSSLRILSRGAPSALPRLVQECRQAGVKLVQRVGNWDVRPNAHEAVIKTSRGTFRAEMILASLGKEPGPGPLPWTVEELKPSFPAGETTVPGIYVIGDLASGRYRQLSVATGMGIAAAMHAAEHLKREYGIKALESSGWK